ncbi:hypothetical protein [Arthrobacter sp. ISL-30]|uniref:hypothetical protein n=1 Tax=Arthrobacter sp. ISL-30 TaxID=2819109 RepID=UPI001BE4EB5B|nr:hypothetical protein [Arthrobacter sp. ISL-30]MBT2515483.1 hypothetical protein [Arthrobacter sp. ISL-30]
MTQRPEHSGDKTDTASSSDAAHRTPRWVKVSGIILLVLAVVLVVMLLSGHGPGRHMGALATPESISAAGAAAPDAPARS